MKLDRIAIVAGAVLAAGCSAKSGDDTGGVADCGVTIDETVPADSSTDAYYRADIEIHLSDADDTTTVSVTDASGAAVSG
ncbi:MAG: hypothetical protein QGG40_07455, partial [Myxococcota bacterium]|nr:hypothetical protein [Myxococcota bacterium]